MEKEKYLDIRIDDFGNPYWLFLEDDVPIEEKEAKKFFDSFFINSHCY